MSSPHIWDNGLECPSSFQFPGLSFQAAAHKPARALLYIADNHEIVLCDCNIAKLRAILRRKAPKYLPDAEVLLAEMSYELIPVVDHAEKLIRDAKDQPILNAAIVSDVNVILTGDKDFLSLDMEHPKCMTVAQFLESEGVEN